MMEYNDIRRLLPHDAPYVLIDRVIAMDEHSITALKNISGGESFSQYHYPSHAIYPGAFIVESAAQAAAILLSGGQKNALALPLLGGIQQFQFLRPVTPGDQLTIQATIIKRVGDLAIASIEITCNEALVARGQLSFGKQYVERI